MLQTHQDDQLAYQTLANQCHDLRHCVDQREAQLTRLSTEFKEMRRHLDVAEERYQSLLQDKNEFKRRLELKHNEVPPTSLPHLTIVAGGRCERRSSAHDPRKPEPHE
jgi:chromosome segregation ATPase